MPDEFDVALLEQLTREGRVYVDAPQVIDKDAYKREILDYVRAIDEFVTEKWKGKIGWLWTSIVEDECFREELTMKRAPQTGHMNRYVVTNIVCRMQNGGVYRSGNVSMLSLHLRLEGVAKKNKYYTCCGNYSLMSKEAKKRLEGLMKAV